jgi:hypothetical protein
MAKTWFPHEDGLEEGEKSEPLFGPRFGAFWWLGMAIVWGFLILFLYMSCTMIFSHTAQ